MEGLRKVGDHRKYRHRWEMPMVWVSALMTLALVAVGLSEIATSGTEVVMADDEEASAASIALLVLAAPFLFYVVRLFMAASVRANSIKVGPRQFPELHARYQAIARAMDMPRPPALYVANGNGQVNAFALECNRRMLYIVVNAEIAHMTSRSPGMVDFVLAHELAHHKMRHVSLFRQIINLVPNLLVVPGRTAERAQEYSADRLALHVCPDTCHAMNILAVGPHMATEVDHGPWLEQCEEERKSFMVRIANLISSHAVLTKRFQALKDIEKHGFDRHGSMF